MIQLRSYSSVSGIIKMALLPLLLIVAFSTMMEMLAPSLETSIQVGTFAVVVDPIVILNNKFVVDDLKMIRVTIPVEDTTVIPSIATVPMIHTDIICPVDVELDCHQDPPTQASGVFNTTETVMGTIFNMVEVEVQVGGYQIPLSLSKLASYLMDFIVWRLCLGLRQYRKVIKWIKGIIIWKASSKTNSKDKRTANFQPDQENKNQITIPLGLTDELKTTTQDDDVVVDADAALSTLRKFLAPLLL